MSARTLAALQQQQQSHDELAHRDILELPTDRRMTHMALHFAKYSGRLIALDFLDRPAVERLIVDSIIICLTAANAIGLDLANEFEAGAELGRLAEDYERWSPFAPAALPMWLGSSMAIENAKFSKACEAFDHRETFPYGEVWQAGVLAILRLCLAAAGRLSFDLASAIAARWEMLEHKYVRHAA